MLAEVQKFDPTLHYQRYCHEVITYETCFFIDNEIHGPPFHGFKRNGSLHEGIFLKKPSLVTFFDHSRIRQVFQRIIILFIFEEVKTFKKNCLAQVQMKAIDDHFRQRQIKSMLQ